MDQEIKYTIKKKNMKNYLNFNRKKEEEPTENLPNEITQVFF